MKINAVWIISSSNVDAHTELFGSPWARHKSSFWTRHNSNFWTRHNSNFWTRHNSNFWTRHNSNFNQTVHVDLYAEYWNDAMYTVDSAKKCSAHYPSHPLRSSGSFMPFLLYHGVQRRMISVGNLFVFLRLLFFALLLLFVT